MRACGCGRGSRWRHSPAQREPASSQERWVGSRKEKKIVTHYLKHKSVWGTNIRRLRTLFHSSTSLLKLHYLKRRIFLRFCVGCIDFMAAKKKKQIKNLLPSSSTSIKAGHALKCPLQPWQGRKKTFRAGPPSPPSLPSLTSLLGHLRRRKQAGQSRGSVFPSSPSLCLQEGTVDLYD